MFRFRFLASIVRLADSQVLFPQMYFPRAFSTLRAVNNHVSVYQLHFPHVRRFCFSKVDSEVSPPSLALLSHLVLSAKHLHLLSFINLYPKYYCPNMARHSQSDESDRQDNDITSSAASGSPLSNSHTTRISHTGKVTKPMTSHSKAATSQSAHVNKSTVTLSAAITVTTGLGETFNPHNIEFTVSLRQSDNKSATAPLHESTSIAVEALESTSSITPRGDVSPPALPSRRHRKVAPYHYPDAHTVQPSLTKASPPYIPRPQITEPVRQGPHKTQDIYLNHRKELEAIAKEHGDNWRHIEYFLWTKGYVDGFRLGKILQFTLNRMKEYAFQITD